MVIHQQTLVSGQQNITHIDNSVVVDDISLTIWAGISVGAQTAPQWASGY